MGSRDPDYLLSVSDAYAWEALRCESIGDRGMAITNYEVAVEILDVMARPYPRELIPCHIMRMRSYKRRILTLHEPVPNPEIDPDAIGGQRRDRLDGLVSMDRPDAGLSDIEDLDGKRRGILRELFANPSKRPAPVPPGWSCATLLYGTPESAPAAMAAAIAGEVGGRIVRADVESIMTEWPGDVAANISRLFGLAGECIIADGNPAVLFVDNVDSLSGSHSGDAYWELGAKEQFIKTVAAVNSHFRVAALYVVGATSRPWRLDRDLLGCFPTRICADRPASGAPREYSEWAKESGSCR